MMERKDENSLFSEDELEVAGLGPADVVRDVLGVVHPAGEHLGHVSHESR